MPWRETGAVDEREAFVEEVLAGVFSRAALCRRYGVSRVTGAKWLERYQAQGRAGLADRSRAPHHHPNAVPASTAEAVVALRERYPHWGPKKLRAFLMRAEPRRAGVWPAASTIGDLLKGRGLAGSRRRRPHTPAYPSPFASCDGPNAVWCVDFKRVVPDGRRASVRAADAERRLQPVSASVPGDGLDAAVGGVGGVGGGVSPVRASGGDSVG